MNYEQNYLAHLAELLKAPEKQDRTGTGTRSIFGHQIRCDLRDGFPLITTKYIALPAIIHELIWFLKGDTNIKYLNENGVNIWNEWANENGELGPVYGEQWRAWVGASGSKYDQITTLIQDIKAIPHSRRLIVTAWNPDVLPIESASHKDNVLLGKQVLPPCHTFFQVNCEDHFIDLQLYQRSADWFLGVPYNVASYSLLLMMLAQVTGRTPRHFIHTFGDTHLYSNHTRQAREQLGRIPYKSPIVTLNPAKTDIDEFEASDFLSTDYIHHEAIRAPIAV